jgi:rod shape-determining protein MreB
MLGKTPGIITAIRPMKDGVIADFEITEAMLGYFIRKVHNRTGSSVPGSSSPSPPASPRWRSAPSSSAERAGPAGLPDRGAHRGGIGAELPIAEPTAAMIVDIGGGTTEVAIMSLADIASRASRPGRGRRHGRAIINHMKKTYNLMIGEQSAERIKIEIGSAAPAGEEQTILVRGRDMISGLPRKTEVTSEEIREALQEPVGDHRGRHQDARAGRAGACGGPGRQRHRPCRRVARSCAASPM